MAISAGPYFKFTPAISFLLNFDPSQDDKAEQHLDELWQKLSDGGEPMMPLQEYPFSKKYGWIKDKFGVTWQLMLTDPSGEPRPFMTPLFLFSGKNANKAQQAIDFYLDVFKKSKAGALSKYEQQNGTAKKGAVMFADFKLEDQWLAAMDSNTEHVFDFNEAISMVINCDNQKEIDYYWEKLSADPKSEQCGWLKDKFGVSWQVTPDAMNDMMDKGTPEQADHVVQALLKMKKIDLAKIKQAYKG